VPGHAHLAELLGDDGEGGRRLRVVTGREGPEVRSRTVRTAGGTGAAVRFLRYENGRFLDYAMARSASGFIAAPAESSDPGTRPRTDPVPVEGTALLRIAHQVNPLQGTTLEPGKQPVEWDTVRLRFLMPGRPGMEADFPRGNLQRLVLGRETDTRDDPRIPGLVPLPEPLGAPGRIQVVQDPGRSGPPWEAELPVLAGEEDPTVVARALGRWFRDAKLPAGSPLVAVATAEDSPAGWKNAPPPGNRPLLLLPDDAFPGLSAGLRERFRKAWKGGAVAVSLPERDAPSLVVLVSAEAPGLLGRRLRELARAPGMEGRLLGVWSLAGPVRPDLPGSLLAEGRLAGLGLAEALMVDWERVAPELEAIAAAAGAGKVAAVEELPGSLLWFY
jgi:hypothetical protein